MLGQIKITSKLAYFMMLFGVCLVVGMFQSSTAVSAKSEVSVTETKQLPDYRYTARPCDSLTKLVRRSVMIYDANNKLLALTKARIIYVETNIVQDMGAYLLDIGDNVVISGQLIASYVNKSFNLSVNQLKAWQRYVPSVDFELSNIQQPKNLGTVKAKIADFLDQVDTDTKTDEDTSKNSSPIWWYAGIGSVAIVWYLLWKREED